jgi:biotin transport system substrate-specific component
MVLADVLSPRRSSLAVWYGYQAALVFAGAALMALSAQLSVNLPFSPVPVTGQTFGVLLVAAALGRIRGTLAVIAYLIEGFSGLPVFAGGAAGFFYAFGPTGGYLLGFIPAAFIVGYLADKGWDHNVYRTAVAMLMGTAVMFFFGLLRLSNFVGFDHILVMGLYPFVIGDLIKIAAAAILLPSVRKFI